MSSSIGKKRPTLFDALCRADRNLYCALSDLTNEASVEAFFVTRLLADLGYEDFQVKTKASISEVLVPRGSKKVRYKPDYILLYRGLPRWIIDAKSPVEALEDWEEQAAGYALYLNQRSPSGSPVGFYVLTNGLTTRIYRWDKLPYILELAFGDFELGNPRYEQMRSLLSVNAQAEAQHRTAPPDSLVIRKPSPEEARRVFAQAHRIIWQAEVINPTAAFTEFAKIMFVKLWTDRTLRKDEAIARALDLTGQVAVPKEAVTFSTFWIEANKASSNPVNDILFKELIRQLEREISSGRKKRIFEPDESIRLRPGTILRVVEKLQHYDMFGIDEDLNGRLFETFLSATMRGRELGQFFTPRSIVKLMVGLADIKVGRDHIDKVIDACCGTGGFLIEALADMRNKIRRNASLTDEEKDSILNKTANESIYGIDFGKNPALARIARMNMYLHGDGGSRVYFADSLDKSLHPTEGEDAEVLHEQDELRRAILAGLEFDVALTNPPFSMVRTTAKPEDQKILSQYDLARVSPSSRSLRRSLRSSVMFVERYRDLLRPGGLLVTVLDDTVLASKQFRFFRAFIRKHFIIRAIVSLPGNAFRRQGSRVKTSVLVLRKKLGPEEQQPPVFGAFALELGVDDLTPRASEAHVQEARTRAESEIQTILRGYFDFLAGTPTGIVVPPEQLSDRLDLKHCVGDRGRLVPYWKGKSIPVRSLGELVDAGSFSIVEDVIDPQGFPDDVFTLLSVSYEGECVFEASRRGRDIKADSMCQVQTNDLIISKIRVTDGAVAVVPEDFDGSLVSSTSYIVLRGHSLTDVLYLWSVLRTHEIRADLAAVSTGTNRYVTQWEEARDIQVPWPDDREREATASIIEHMWALEAQKQAQRLCLYERLRALGLESPESIARFKASKAPL